MAATWYIILAFMLTAYVVLDGFDFGAGIVHLYVAKTDEERKQVFAAIGPVWDANEVWLIASGGVLLFAFPHAYAAAFSGLYLPLMIALWLLILRGCAIAFRSELEHRLWRTFWDSVFAHASGAVALVLGVALGNVLRGVPIDSAGWFSEDLFGSSNAAGRVAAIDAYTLLLGVFSFAVLGAHGATFLQWRLAGEVGERSRRAAVVLWWATLVLASVTTSVTVALQPLFVARFLHRPWLWPVPMIAVLSLLVVVMSLRRRRELRTFLASGGFIAAMLLGAAGALFPDIVRSAADESRSITAYSATSERAGLMSGLIWWVPATAVAIAYFTYLFHSMRRKVGDRLGH